jgi:organic hydroperoxide reductase OsmC/OhrA
MTWPGRALSPYSTETVWNTGLSGTAVASDGRTLTVGQEGAWAPEYLLLLAAESCFMTTLLGLARDAHVQVLGYVSKGRLQARDVGESPAVVLMPCVVVASEDDVSHIMRLSNNVTRESIVARLLGDRLRVTLDVRALPLDETR